MSRTVSGRTDKSKCGGGIQVDGMIIVWTKISTKSHDFGLRTDLEKSHLFAHSPPNRQLEAAIPITIASGTDQSASYLYFDNEGYTQWQREASGLPFLDLFVD